MKATKNKEGKMIGYILI